MNKIKIILSTKEMIRDFVTICSKYNCDINLYDGKNILDAKSIMGVLGVAQGKIIEVLAISPDESVISLFVEDMREFEI